MLRSTFFGFEAAKSALYANQKSLDIAGHNMANSQTDGYTRQRVERSSVYVSSSGSRIASKAYHSAGAGVRTLGVSQIRDSFVDKCYRDECSLCSYYSKSSDILNDILDVFPEGADITDESGLIGAMENLYNSLNDYIQNPTYETDANIVKTAFSNIIQVLHQADTNLSTVASRQTSDLGTTINRTNELLEQISHINEIIAKNARSVSDVDSSYFSSNELLDERNMMLDELSSYCDINVLDNADGTVDIEIGGKKILGEGKLDALTMMTDSEGYVNVAWRSSGETTTIAAGTINAYIEVINGRGPNVQSNAETTTCGIPYYRDRLDSFATNLANIVNSSIPEKGADGKPSLDAGGNIIYKTLLSAKPSDGSTSANMKASNISISDEWNQNGAGYFIYSEDENVEDYAQHMSSRLFTEKSNFVSRGEQFEGSFSDYLTDMVGRVGTDVNFNMGRKEAAASVANDFYAKRDSISGVQQDEETANLLTFQKSYQAAARVMTVMNDILDTLINQLGASIG